MSDQITIKMRVPVLSEPVVAVPGLIFHHWFPLSSEDRISVDIDSFRIELCFDQDSLSGGQRGEPEDVSRWANVIAMDLPLQVEVRDLEEELLSYIASHKIGDAPDYDSDQLAMSYEELGKSVLKHVIRFVNRLICFARVIKGQYWLQEYSYNPERAATYFNRFNASATIDGEAWFTWHPTHRESIIAVMEDPARYVHKEDWSEVDTFISGENRAPLVYELLSGAELFKANNQARPSLTEAITALEVALSNFARAGKIGGILPQGIVDRLDTDSLSSQISHLGLSGSVRYLLPILFNDEQLPTEWLKDCQGAITERQNVVHQGQRDVDPKRLQRYIKSVRNICEWLEEYTPAA